MYVPLTRVMSAVLHPHFMFVVGALRVNDHYGLALDCGKTCRPSSRRSPAVTRRRATLTIHNVRWRTRARGTSTKWLAGITKQPTRRTSQHRGYTATPQLGRVSALRVLRHLRNKQLFFSTHNSKKVNASPHMLQTTFNFNERLNSRLNNVFDLDCRSPSGLLPTSRNEIIYAE